MALTFDNIINIARGAYYDFHYAIYLTSVIYDICDSVEYYVLYTVDKDEVARKRIAKVRYRKDGSSYIKVDGKRVSLDMFTRLA